MAQKMFLQSTEKTTIGHFNAKKINWQKTPAGSKISEKL